MSHDIHRLDPGYVSEVDTLDESAWYRALAQFDDASIYQTWAYDEVRVGRKRLSHLVLKKDGEPVALAQAQIAKLPLIKAGIAYVRWGPVWRRRTSPFDRDIFRQAVRSLRNEYAGRRGLVLRLYPILFRESCSDLASILGEEGFSPVTAERTDRTLLLDLNPSLAELRKGLRPHWLRYLKFAEKSQLEIIDGSDDNSFETFIGIYREMVGRKKFAEPNDIEEFRAIQRSLPEQLKMKVLLCKSEGKVCAGLICSAIGNTGVYLFGATSNIGLKSRGSYLLHWKLIEWLKQNGVSTYDLHGIDPVENPGTYKFKADLCGSNGKDVHFFGRVDSCMSTLSYSCVTGGDALRVMYKRIRRTLAGRKPQKTSSNSCESTRVASDNA